jgi:hypothetical protein
VLPDDAERSRRAAVTAQVVADWGWD